MRGPLGVLLHFLLPSSMATCDPRLEPSPSKKQREPGNPYVLFRIIYGCRYRLIALQSSGASVGGIQPYGY